MIADFFVCGARLDVLVCSAFATLSSEIHVEICQVRGTKSLNDWLASRAACRGLFGRTDQAAGELAKFADAAHIAGVACERSYDALIRKD